MTTGGGGGMKTPPAGGRQGAEGGAQCTARPPAGERSTRAAPCRQRLNLSCSHLHHSILRAPQRKTAAPPAAEIRPRSMGIGGKKSRGFAPSRR